jgi:hypothetical protein
MCFKWCMRYHQTKYGPKDRLVKHLRCINDKYDYEGVHFPASIEDIKLFEDLNMISMFVYKLEDGNINRYYIGKPDYITNDKCYLLLIEDGYKHHYVYIKHISRLLNLSHYKTCEEHCPYCEKNIIMKEATEANPKPETFKEHTMACYKLQFNDGTFLKLPPKNTYMKFKNYKNMLVRPFIVYADCESTLVPCDDEHKVSKHVVNSCCYNFVCTFDTTRNRMIAFEGSNCLIKMVESLDALATECIGEMQKTNAW